MLKNSEELSIAYNIQWEIVTNKFSESSTLNIETPRGEHIVPCSSVTFIYLKPEKSTPFERGLPV